MNKIFSAENIVEVGLLRNLLQQNGISCELRNHHASSLMGEVPFTNVWPEIWVDEANTDQALALIADIKRAEVGDVDWVCRGCREANPANFDLCWQCGELNSAGHGARN